MKQILFENTPFMLTMVTGSYLFGVWVYKRSKIALLHPCLICMIIIISFLTFMDIPYESFKEGSKLIDFMLGPSVVALGLLLYNQLEHVKGNVISILTAIATGALISVLSVIAIGKLFGLEEMMIVSLEPKSVTTPIAVSLSTIHGGIPALTAVTVVICGISGAAFGPKILSLCGIKSPIAVGLSLGAASHGLGTARAMEIGAIEGAIGGLSIGIMGIMTSIAIPLVDYLMQLI